MSGIPYLGSKISLISKSEIRYEGILVDVNPQESTITFEQVRFFGTEGRRPTDEIAPMDKVFDCVVFRSADIKDLQVYETPKEEIKITQQKDEFPDPAVVSFAAKSSSPGQTGGFHYQSKSKTTTENTNSSEEVKMPKINVNNYASAAASVSLNNQHQHQSHQNQTKSFSTSNSNSNSNYTRNRSTSNFTYNRPSTRVVVPKSEFDFSQSNAKFSKDGGEEESTTVPSYNKNLSFFDDISCQANTETSRGGLRNDRNLNMETFGQAAPPRRYGGGGYRGGRGRGGYNRNREGYSRGGYNNSYNNNASGANTSNNPNNNSNTNN